MSKNSSAKYYQENKERLQKKQKNKVFLKKKKNPDNMIMNHPKIYQKIKNKN